MKGKRLLTAVLAATTLLGSVGVFSGCDKGSLDPFYNTTYTLTGKGLAIEWDKENQPDNGYKALSGQFSFRSLIEQYWDDFDFTGSSTPANVDEAITLLSGRVESCYSSFEGLSYTLSSKDDLTLTITYPEAAKLEPLVVNMAESQEDFDALYPNLNFEDGSMFSPSFMPNEDGRMCSGVVQYKGVDGNTYDRVISFSVNSAYGSDHKTLGDIVTIACDLPVLNADNTVDGWYILPIHGYAFEAKDFQKNPGISFQVNPEVTVTKN